MYCEKVIMRATLAGACAFLLLLAVPQAAAPQAEVPTWQVGDTWAMGAKNLDLTTLLQYVADNLQQQYEAMGWTTNINLTGTASVYYLFEVVEVQATQYKVSVSIGASMDVNGTISISSAGQAASATLSYTLTMTADGYIYFTKDTLAVARQDASGDINYNMSIKAQGDGQAMDVDMVMDASFQLTATFDPALDLFDFPIAVGENWTAESDVTMTGAVSGKVSMSGYGEYSATIPLDNITHISASVQCPGTESVTLEDGSVSTCYKLTYSGLELGGMNLPLMGGTSYYSPDSGRVVKCDLPGLPGVAGKTGATSLGGLESGASLGSMGPVSVQDARDFITGLKAEGIDLLLVGFIAATIIVVIVVVVLAVRRRRTRLHETELPQLE